MGINALMMCWLGRLHERGIIRSNSSILELGPQTILTTRDVTLRLLARTHGESDALLHIDNIFNKQDLRPNGQKHLYSALGLIEYASADVMDPSADIRVDMNHVFSAGRTFDVITNFGTAEHVFNIAAVFESIHNNLCENGIILHQLPVLNDVNHGFWAINPTTYFDIARENNYVIEDFVYADNVPARNERLERGILEAGDFDQFAITQNDAERHDFHLQAKATWNFARNLSDREGMELSGCGKYPARVFDHCLVAMRKRSGSRPRPFQFPRQRLYLT